MHNRPWKKCLSADKVLAIVDMARSTDKSQREISEEFGIDRKSVGNILNGETWSWLTGIKKK